MNVTEEEINKFISLFYREDYEFSDKIKKRIHDTYESLPDRDKLLLELGEDI